MKIDISLCPSELQFPNGDTYDEEKLCEAISYFCSERYPNADVSVQVGARQGHKWALVNRDEEEGFSLLDSFFMKHGCDSHLFAE